MLTQQLGELVDDDEQHRHRHQRQIARANALILGDIAAVACGPEHLLPTVHLTGEGFAHPSYQLRFFGEIGDDGRYVPSPIQAKECGTPLEVDQH